MVEIRQTKFGGEEGNCLAACICSILEVDELDIYDALPNNSSWLSYLNDNILCKYDLYLYLTECENPPMAFHGYHLIMGDNIEKPWSHCQVGLNGEFIFDPMGQKTPIKVFAYGLLVKRFQDKALGGSIKPNK